MKKLIIILSFCFSFYGITNSMYYNSQRKLKYDQVTLKNKSSIPFQLEWREGPGNEVITHAIPPGTTVTVKIGEKGGYHPNYGGAKITYNPIKNNQNFKQEFMIDLPNAKAFAFNTVKLADVMNNVLVPVVFTSDDKGEFNTFQYKNLQHPTEWEKTLLEIGKSKAVSN